MKLSHITLALSLILAAGFVFFGVQKFGSENLVFAILAERSGISIFEPGARIATGIAEILTAIMLVVPRTRILGALSAVAVLCGAIFFHLTPWLGIVVPGIGIGLFATAVVMMVLALIHLGLRFKAGELSFQMSLETVS